MCCGWPGATRGRRELVVFGSGSGPGVPPPPGMVVAGEGDTRIALVGEGGQLRGGLDRGPPAINDQIVSRHVRCSIRRQEYHCASDILQECPFSPNGVLLTYLSTNTSGWRLAIPPGDTQLTRIPFLP